MDEAGAREVGEAFQQLFHELHEKFRAQVRGLDHGTLNWRPLPKANSIAVLVVHSLGSQREMLRAVRQITVERDRDSELKAEAEEADLRAMIEQAAKHGDVCHGALTDGD